MSDQLTPEMVRSLEQELAAKEAELAKISKSRGQCRPIVMGEESDNSELSAIAEQEHALRTSISSIRRTLDTCPVIELDSSDKTVVGVGAIVTLELTEEGDEPFEVQMTLAKDTNIDMNRKIAHFTLNSPIGKCIVGQKVGFIGEYTVKGNAATHIDDSKYGCKILAIQY
ncbi:MAG: GreA/GreB family elongation factor [Clostridia bacterium]|nr:GreA/GreB family elongation factor [Clostridia bacterium]